MTITASSFADLGVPPALVASLAARGITSPFPIQAATIADALAGRDLCGRAPTGSGKTIAFGIPLVLRAGKAKPRRPRALVLVPTRELAAQVCHELQLLAKPDGPWVESFYGGVGFDRQVKALRRGVDIVVACPGRLADLVGQGLADLSDVDLVVIDEADRMADMGFLPEVRRLLDRCATRRQTLLFSATLDGDVDVLISRYQHDPARHEHAGDEHDAAMAEHHFWAVERPLRLATTAAVVKRAGPTVVFCRTKRGADRIARQLEAAGVRAAAIHGDRSQSQRERALQSFHRGQVEALVATDVAARGIHVDGVACVVHFDPPGDAKDYVHRSGRTARAGAAGAVVTLVPGELRRDMAKIQRELGHPPGLTRPAPESLTEGRAQPAARAHRADVPLAERAPAEPAGRRSPRVARPSRSAAPTRSTGPARSSQPSRSTPDASVSSPRPAAKQKAAAADRPRPSGAARRKAKRLNGTGSPTAPRRSRGR